MVDEGNRRVGQSSDGVVAVPWVLNFVRSGPLVVVEEEVWS